jgi:hypothetical protein
VSKFVALAPAAPAEPALAFVMPAGPPAADGFGLPLATAGAQFALAWNDPAEPAGVGTSFRVAWVQDGAVLVGLGPRLPFTRADTPGPAGMRVGQDLYVVGAPAARRSTAAVGGAGGRADPDAGAPAARLTVYRVPWGADADAAVAPVATLPRTLLGDLPVVAAAAEVAPDGASFGLAWVEFQTAGGVGRGARYALYMALHALPR